MHSKHIQGYKAYLKLEKGLSENSIMAYIRDLRKLIAFVEENYASKELEELSSEILSDFVQSIVKQNIAPRSQARIISGIKSFYTYLLIEDKIENDPTEHIAPPKIGQSLPTVLSVDEIEALLSAIDLSKPAGHRDKAILETLYGCGLRVSELINIKLSDLYFDEGFIRVTGKGNKERLVPVGQKAVKEIQFYLDSFRNKIEVDAGSAEYLFLNQKGKRLSRVSVFNIIKSLAEKVGITKNISPHTLRHSFATHLVEGGANIRAVQEMLGHESIVTTEVYAHIDKDYLRSEIIEYHPRS